MPQGKVKSSIPAFQTVKVEYELQPFFSDSQVIKKSPGTILNFPVRVDTNRACSPVSTSPNYQVAGTRSTNTLLPTGFLPRVKNTITGATSSTNKDTGLLNDRFMNGTTTTELLDKIREINQQAKKSKPVEILQLSEEVRAGCNICWLFV